MARIAMDPEASLELRGRMYADLAQFVYPKRKAVEQSGPDGGPLEVLSLADAIRARRRARMDPGENHTKAPELETAVGEEFWKGY
jgi:hypothetical protein